jgi:hypothetical protein
MRQESSRRRVYGTFVNRAEVISFAKAHGYCVNQAKQIGKFIWETWLDESELGGYSDSWAEIRRSY